MRSLLVNHSYLGMGDLFAPGRWLDRWLHPYQHAASCQYRNKTLTVRWTRRAQRQLQQLEVPLLVEMQLYFSCMVKKRVLFHSSDSQSDNDIIKVNHNLSVTVRTLQSDQCDPVEFARDYPGKRVLDAPGARKMRPRELNVDFEKGQWQGEFSI